MKSDGETDHREMSVTSNFKMGRQSIKAVTYTKREQRVFSKQPTTPAKTHRWLQKDTVTSAGLLYKPKDKARSGILFHQFRCLLFVTWITEYPKTQEIKPFSANRQSPCVIYVQKVQNNKLHDNEDLLFSQQLCEDVLHSQIGCNL